MIRNVLAVATAVLAGAVLAGQPVAAADSTEIGRGWLGVYSENPTEAARIALGIEHGVLVADVAEGSPAAKAGLRQGDVILEIAGVGIVDGSVLRQVVRGRPGREVAISVLRRRELVSLTATLASRSRFDRGLWTGPSGDAMRMAALALRRVGKGEVPDEVRARILGIDERLESMDALRSRLDDLQEQIRRETDALRRELLKKTGEE